MKILSVHISATSNDDAAWWRVNNIAKILRLKGHEVHLKRYIIKSPYSIPIMPFKHLKTLIKDDYDLVYGNTHVATFGSLLGKLAGTPLIFDMHGGLIEESLFDSSKISPKFLLNSFIDFVDLEISNKVICVSKKMIEYINSQKRVPLEKIAYVTNGVDLEFFKPNNCEKVDYMKKQLGIEDKLVFGYMGGFQKWQGVNNFIKAVKEINDKDLALLVIGGDKNSVEGNITFISKISRSQIQNYYNICDVLVLPRPSYQATEMAAPTKFAEYTAIGKSILTTNVGDAADFVREYNCGIVAEDNSTENLIKAIYEFKNKSNDELKIMGNNSRTLAENEFDWNKIGINLLKTVELYQ